MTSLRLPAGPPQQTRADQRGALGPRSLPRPLPTDPRAHIYNSVYELLRFTDLLLRPAYRLSRQHLLFYSVH